MWRGARLVAMLLLVAGAAYATFLFWPRPVPASPALPAGASVEAGRYLATIGNCAACHSAPSGEAYAGGVRFETPFGRIYSTNITADREQGIGGWSFGQFHAAMTRGVRPDGSHLYPAFPYTAFARMSDTDIGSLYLYFRTIAPSPQRNAANAMSFPFGNRELLYFWKRFYLDDLASLMPQRASAEQRRGAYLVQAVAHCGACHTPRGWLGGEDEDQFLGGGIYTDQVANGAYRLWSAPDLTRARHGLARWNRDDIRAYLTTGISRHSIVNGPMNEVFASTRQLTPADARAVSAYLANVRPSTERWPRLFNPSRHEAGRQVFTVHCATCHLPDGRGDEVLGVPLAGNAIVQARDPASLINVILYGPDLPPPPFSVSRTRMRPFGRRLSDEDIAAVATYLRSSFGNRASAVEREQVERQR
jgi:mono/diheme cytochrome c family protein